MTYVHYCEIMRFTVLHNRHNKVSQSVPFFMHCKPVTILTADSTGLAFWASSEITMAEYGSCGKRRGGIHWIISSTVIIRYIYFCHERTTVTPEKTQNAILVWFNFTLCYLLPTATCMTSNKGRHLVWSHQQLWTDIFCNSGKNMEHYDPKEISNKANPIPNLCRYRGNAYFLSFVNDTVLAHPNKCSPRLCSSCHGLFL